MGMCVPFLLKRSLVWIFYDAITVVTSYMSIAISFYHLISGIQFVTPLSHMATTPSFANNVIIQ